MSENLIINNENENKDYFIKIGEKIIDVFLMKIEIDYDKKNDYSTTETYIMTVCKREEIGNTNVKIISRITQNSISDINLKEIKDFKEIKSNNIIVTFFLVFSSQIDTELFKHSENFVTYKTILKN